MGGVKRIFKTAFPASILLICLVSYSFADPSNGTGGGTQAPPGQAGEHNPHGSPPGQGGSAPGNSGAHNPHGTPPGQRIGGSEATGGGGGSGVNYPATNGASPQYSGQGIVSKMGKMPSQTVSPAAEQQKILLEREINSLQGWEPDWYIASMRFFRCSVSSRLVVTTSGWGYSRDLKIERDGGAERGWERMEGQPSREWFRKYPDSWSRIEGGNWQRGLAGGVRLFTRPVSMRV